MEFLGIIILIAAVVAITLGWRHFFDRRDR